MVSTSGRLEGKVALITGASPNIGGTAAAGFAAQGAAVACNDLRPETAEQTAQSIRNAGGEALAVPADVTDPEAVADMVKVVLDRYGQIDILLNNAAMFYYGGVLNMPPDGFLRQVEVILGGAFIATQAVARSMVNAGNGGSIINVLSTAAWQGEANNIGYSSSKSALINFTRSAAIELAPHRIRVNSFTPTVTVPERTRDGSSFPEHLEEIKRTKHMDFAGMFPWHRLPSPADYVGPLILLASDESTLMTGGNITVDGGALARYWPQVPAAQASLPGEAE
jgi:NAD(P)-dependent dehydrogenase (short-subunit alcohol dehydrogenase family)